MSDSSVVTQYYEYRQRWRRMTDQVIGEALVIIYVNGLEMASVMCTPQQEDLLALGFLKNEGLIDQLSEVDHVHIGGDGCCVDVWLRHAIRPPQRRIITSGCGHGSTFSDPTDEIESIPDGAGIEPEALTELFDSLHPPQSLHVRARGVHTAGLASGARLLMAMEDVGRHNSVDKLVGACLLEDISTPGLILLTTGRVSSEMLRKGATMGCPIIASRNSPTSMSVAMAQVWNITLIGYVRRASMRVYTHPQRLGCTLPSVVKLAEE